MEKHKKVVTKLSTIDNDNDFLEVTRKIKSGGKWETMNVKKPYAIERYNAYMNWVEKWDQVLLR